MGTASCAHANTRYAYNGLGYRVSKLADGKGRNEDNDDNRLFAYDDGATLLGEYSLKGKPITETVYLNGAPILALWNQKAGFILSDHLGTPRLIADDKARPLWAWNTLAFGATAPVEKFKNSEGFNYNLRFPGQYYDAETGLHYNIHRYYDPQTGRFTTSDPIGLAGGINTYLYANANPLKYTDPEGLTPNPAEAACLAGPNPVCAAGVAVHVVTTIVGACMVADSLFRESADKCKKIIKGCAESCAQTFADDPRSLPGKGSDMQSRIRMCIRDCAKAAGCPY